MAWTPTKDKGSVTQYHGGVVQVRPCSSAGVAASAWVDVGFVRKVELSDATPSSSVTDGAGNTIATIDGTREISITLTGLQRAKASLDFVDTRDQFYWLYFKASKTSQYQVGGTAKTLEMVCALAELEPTLKHDFSGASETEMVFRLSKVDDGSTVSVVCSAMASSHTATMSSTTQAVSGTDANPYYKFIET